MMNAVIFAEDPSSLERLRLFRHALPAAVNERVAHNGMPKVGTDFAVPDSALPEMMAAYAEVTLPHVLFGHIGDNHLHMNLFPRSPEELIAAAHASCYSMALSHALAGNGTPAASLDTSAVVSFQPGVGITGSHLTVVANVPGLTAEEFQTFAAGAKDGCPVSKALAGVEITLDASLAG